MASSLCDRNERRQYASFDFCGQFGGLCGLRCQHAVVLRPLDSLGNYSRRLVVATGLCENVLFADVTLNGAILHTLSVHTAAQVSCLAAGVERGMLVVGYEDGVVVVCVGIDDPCDGPVEVFKFEGHSGALECVAFSGAGERVFATGSRDSSIILWDVTGERALFRLKGHKDSVQALQFSHFRTDKEFLVSGSKDRVIRVWDPELAHCVACISDDLESAVWALLVVDARYVVCGESGNDLKVYEVVVVDEAAAAAAAGVCESAPPTDRFKVRRMAPLYRGGRSRTKALEAVGGGFVCLHGGSLKAFRFVGSDKRRRARAGALVETEDLFIEVALPAAADTAKHRSLHVTTGEGSTTLVTSTLHNELCVVRNLPPDLKSAATTAGRFEKAQAGHADVVQCLALSADERVLASGSGGAVLLWNLETRECFGRLATGEAAVVRCVAFANGGRALVAGDDAGNLVTFDVARRSVVASVRVHEAAVAAVHVFGGGGGGGGDEHMVTGAKDQTVSVFEWAAAGGGGVFRRTASARMDDQVEVVRASGNGGLVACGLTDCTIKVLFGDTLKLFLNLYGHAGPVTALDISFDSEVLVSGSVDRTLRVWGLRFGDCRRSLTFHEGAISALAFVPLTYHFFAASKDARVSRWDAEHFQRVQVMKRGHFGPVSAMACGFNVLVSGSTDRTLRLWRRADEIVMPQVEIGEEQAQLMAKDDEKAADPALPNGSRAADAAPVLSRGESAMDAADRLMDAIELHRQSVVDENKIRAMLDMFKTESTHELVLRQLRGIKANLLNSALVMLPFSMVHDLFGLIHSWISAQTDLELCARCFLFVLTQHHSTISASESHRQLAKEIGAMVKDLITRLHDTAQSNLAKLNALGAGSRGDGIASSRRAPKKRRIMATVGGNNTNQIQ